MQRKYLIIPLLVLVAIAGAGAMWWKISGNVQQQPIPRNLPLPSVVPPPSPVASSTQSEATSTAGMKIYRNTDWGFEFQYPKDWITLENSFGGYYTKFNVIAAPNIAESNRNPFLVNVVLPEFADRTFLGSNPTTSTIIVGGISGVKYKYEFEGSSETAIVVPLKQYKVILGTTVVYQNDFDRIVPTFRFLK